MELKFELEESRCHAIDKRQEAIVWPLACATLRHNKFRSVKVRVEVPRFRAKDSVAREGTGKCSGREAMKKLVDKLKAERERPTACGKEAQ